MIARGAGAAQANSSESLQIDLAALLPLRGGGRQVHEEGPDGERKSGEHIATVERYRIRSKCEVVRGVYTRQRSASAGLTCQTSRVPAKKYSLRLRAISRRVLPLLRTSTARSGIQPRHGLRRQVPAGQLGPTHKRNVRATGQIQA